MAEWETAALHAPKSLHDFLISGSGALRPAVGEWTPLPELHSTEGSNPPRLNLGPVKAVRHGGSGRVASEGERGRKRERETKLAVEKSCLRLREGWMVERSQEGMFVKGERTYVQLLRGGMALHQNSNS